MDRVTTALRRPKEEKNDESFKFAISLLIATLTIIYNFYLYIDNNPISNQYREILNFVELLMISTLAFMVLFLFVKALSLEIKNPIVKEKLESSAHDYYLMSFTCGVSYFIVTLSACITAIILNTIFLFLDIQTKTFPINESMILLVIIVNILPRIKRTKLLMTKNKQPVTETKHTYAFYDEIFDSFFNILKLLDSTKAIIILVVVLTSFWIISDLENGKIIIEMDDIYKKQNEQIPIEITVTGKQYNDLVVNLSKVDFENNLKLVDSLKIESTDNPNIVILSRCLIGNTFDCGKYKFYINSTNLTEGYYELSASTGEESLKRSLMKTKVSSFYLIDK